jgi:hypothetical protein
VCPKVGLDGCGKSRPPPGFDPRTVKHVVSRHTDRVTPADPVTYIALSLRFSQQQMELFAVYRKEWPYAVIQHSPQTAIPAVLAVAQLLTRVTLPCYHTSTADCT